VLALLKSEDLDVQIHAVKVVANLAAEGLDFAPRNCEYIPYCLDLHECICMKNFPDRNLQKEILRFRH
jgi:hypothetical protein